VNGTLAGVMVVAALIAVAGVVEFRARRGLGPATAAEALGAAMRTVPGRLVVLGTWLWLGVHFLAR
jgi:hypothetical protein